MKSRFAVRLLGSIVLLPLLVAADPSTQPSGADVMNKYIEATGGKAAYEKITSRVASGKMSMPSQNLNGDLTFYSKAPDLAYQIVNLPGVGMIERGFDGKTAWEKNPLTGTRILQGEEKDQFQRESTLNNELDWQKLYRSAENLGLEKVGDVPCYKIQLTSNGGQVETRFYNVETGLLAQVQLTAKTGQGDFPVTATISDWRDVGGVKIPFKSTQELKAMNFQQIITLDKVDANIEIAPDKFALPDDVKAILNKPATTQAE